jgi:DNA replication and repair protein RecF
MLLTHLRLVNIRNHRRTDIDTAPGLNVFVGANAQGKSTILEAAELAATGRSRRAGHDAEVVMIGESWARVHAAARRANRDEEVDLAFRLDASAPGPGRVWREIRINGIPVRRGELFGHLLGVVAGPDDSEVAAGRPAFRRRLVDVLLSQISPAYYYIARRYARAVVQRNGLLRVGAGQRAELAAWDEQVASLGAAITRRRRDLVGRLAARASRIYGELSGGREQLVVSYVPNLSGTDEEDLVRSARRSMAEERHDEMARGVTLVGPHRDDITVEVDGRLLRLYGSRGQQVAAVLALRLAEREVLREETGEEPILLLDDVVMALDEPRQAQVLAFVRGAQVLMTITTLATLPALPLGAAVFHVTGGTVEAQRAHLA